jgi:hypothetical protein
MATSTSFSLDTSFILGLLTGTGPPLLEVTTTTGMKLLMKGIQLANYWLLTRTPGSADLI